MYMILFANMDNMLLVKYFIVWLCESVVCMETIAVCILNCCNYCCCCFFSTAGMDYGVRI